MTNIRRYKKDGQIYFLTNITYNRSPILIKHFDLFKNAIKKYKNENNFEIVAFVVLPDHFHLLIDPLSNDISSLMRKIKLSFSVNFRKRLNIQKGRVWQYRFWDHIVRDQIDYNNHMDYIHFNPVKHNYVKSPFEWRYSSINKFNEIYTCDWGIKEDIKFDGDYGE